MHALIVLSHPDTASLTHAVATRIGEGLVEAGSSFEIADLHSEGFDPRYSAGDGAAHHHQASRPADVVAEQVRIERADALVLVFPVYWWSMPALMKGWIDRVFSNGWAYDDSGDKVIKKLGHLPIHLVGIGGADIGTYERHGYVDAMKTQIDHGIFDYCGAPVSRSELLLESDAPDQSKNLESARSIGRAVFAELLKKNAG
ncbi:NAD(P)H-dependent oxidoreductase [Neorhizobium sp. JUb45]|uniref:NAD(P)H-dependent oxidoreductase n=1 Tax=unclassified Neorhizobium TaxID=2629175 RepID=UPI00104A0D0E|nr:NAD(P)H-dependent oxidoreductase [Neorhizobium sp. JUb45]TCR06540.1 NAD(P)H dehydrogenase (quinone) [Neorhizobium sp. JUb45]